MSNETIEERLQNLKDAKKGISHNITVIDSYVRLFTYHMPENYKNCSTLFKLDDVQGGQFQFLVNLSVQKGNENELFVRKFIIIPFFGDGYLNNLVAVQIDNNTIEVYYKMGGAQSPNLNILSNSQSTKDGSLGYIEEDCETVVDTLPEGTQYIAEIMVRQEIDTGWKPVQLYEGYSSIYWWAPCEYRRIGKFLSIHGIIKGFSSVDFTTFGEINLQEIGVTKTEPKQFIVNAINDINKLAILFFNEYGKLTMTTANFPVTSDTEFDLNLMMLVD